MSRTPRRRPPVRTFWDKAAYFPPILCRLFAKTPGRYGAPLSNQQIAARTGLAEIEVVAISQQFDWTGVDLPTMRRFLHACGVDFENSAHMKRVTSYARGEKRHGLTIPPKFTYLRDSPDWATFYLPLMTKLHAARISPRNLK